MSDFFSDAIATLDRTAPIRDAGEFWRMEDPVLHPETRGLLKGGMWGHQRTAWNLKNFIVILVGGYGSGKSLILGKRAISAALQNAPCMVAVVSPTFPTARRTVIPIILNLLAGKRSIYGKEFWYRYNKSTHEVTIRFHGRVATLLFLSGDDPRSLRGPTLAWAGIDEPFIQDEEVFHQMVARVRHPEAPNLGLWGTGTPEQLNWGYDLCEGELGQKHDVGVVRASTRDNKILDPGYVSRLEASFDGKAAQAYIEGEFVDFTVGQVYYSFSRDNMVRLDPEPGVRLGCGMDFNVNPMSATMFWHAADHMHIFDEIELPNADTEYLCDHLHQKYPALKEIYPDSTGNQRHASSPGGRTSFQIIRASGFNINAPSRNPNRFDRYNAVNGKLRSKSGKVTLTIDPRCKKLKKYLTVYSHSMMNKQKEMSHLLDAMGYPVAYLYPISKDRVTTHQIRGL